jgi:hypothetical protein
LSDSVQQEMTSVYRRLEAGKLESQDATRRVYILEQIAKVITVAELETRLTELEAQQALSGQNRALSYLARH